MVKTNLNNKYVAGFIFVTAFASLGFGSFKAGETHAAWDIYTNGFGVTNPGVLQCFEAGELVLGIPSKDVAYLGSGEWRLKEPDGNYQTFSKAVTDSCLVVPTSEASIKVTKAPPITSAMLIQQGMPFGKE